MSDSSQWKKYLGIVVATCLLLPPSVLLYKSWWRDQREKAFAAIEQESKAGMKVTWTEGDNEIPVVPSSSSRSTRFMKPKEVFISYDMVDPTRAGKAFAHFGSTQKLSVSAITNKLVMGGMPLEKGSSPETINSFLENLAPGKSLEVLIVTDLLVDDSVCQSLGRLRDLREVVLLGTDVTGEKFPMLPSLRTVEFAHSRVTESGLARVLSCPKIVAVRIDGKIGASGIRRAVSGASRSLSRLVIMDDSLSRLESKQAWKDVKRDRPKLSLLINDAGSPEW